MPGAKNDKPTVESIVDPAELEQEKSEPGTQEPILEKTTAETIVETLPEYPVEPEAVMPEPVKPEITVEELPDEPPTPPEPETTTAPATKPKEPDPVPAASPKITPEPKPTIEPPTVTDKIPPPVESPSAPPVVPTPSNITVEQVKRDMPVVPAKHDPKYTKGVPKKVLELTDEEINAARKLWAREHIAYAQKQSNVNRKIRMNKMLDSIEAVVKKNPQTTTHAVANDIGISEKSASGYLQKLVKAGRINASGNSRNRRYF